MRTYKFKVGVIPAAGKGKRLSDLPLTRVLPKPLLPVLNKPILEYVIENMKKMGVEEVNLIVGFKKEIIKEYFGAGEDFGIRINYIDQPDPQGIAQAIELAKEYVKEPFVVMLGDDFTIAHSFDNLVKDFFKFKALAVEGVVLEEKTEILQRSCEVLLDENQKISNIEEKPKLPKSNIRGCGIYLFDPKVFDYIQKTPIMPPREEKEITNTIKLISSQGLAVGSFIKGINININTLADLVEAMHLLLDNNNLKK